MVPSLSGTQVRATRAPASSGAPVNFAASSSLPRSVGKAAVLADVAASVAVTGGQIIKNVKKERDGGTPGFKAAVGETVGALVTVGAEKVIRTAVVAGVLTLGAVEPLALPVAAPLLLDTWNRADSTAKLLGDSSRKACYSLLGEDKKF